MWSINTVTLNEAEADSQSEWSYDVMGRAHVQ